MLRCIILITISQIVTALTVTCPLPVERPNPRGKHIPESFAPGPLVFYSKTSPRIIIDLIPSPFFTSALRRVAPAASIYFMQATSTTPAVIAQCLNITKAKPLALIRLPPSVLINMYNTIAIHNPIVVLYVTPKDTYGSVIRALTFLRVYSDYDTFAITSPSFDMTESPIPTNYIIYPRVQHAPIIVELPNPPMPTLRPIA